MIEARAREEIARISGLLATRGFVANHDGNASVRVGPNRVVCTPTSTAKLAVRRDHLVLTDAGGRQIGGRGKPFSELALHLLVYRMRGDASAVLHAHPPYATALGCAGRELIPFLPEAVVSLGTRIPLAPPTLPGAPAVAALEPFVAKYDAVLLAGNGVLSWGVDLEQAWLRLELVEHLATIAAHAAPLGGPQPLPAEVVAKLLEARKKVFGRG